jgi:hypothetical protein
METPFIQPHAPETNKPEIAMWQQYVPKWQAAQELKDPQAREAALDGLTVQIVADTEPGQLREAVTETAIAQLNATNNYASVDLNALRRLPPAEFDDFVKAEESGQYIRRPAPYTPEVEEALEVLEGLKGPADLSRRVAQYIADHQKDSFIARVSGWFTWIPALERGRLVLAKERAAQATAQAQADRNDRNDVYSRI